MMTLLDEYTRQSLAIQVERQLTASEVLAVLEKAMARYGVPGYIRSDNGPEFIAAKVQQWLRKKKDQDDLYRPGKSVAKWLHRELPQSFSRRMSGSRNAPQSTGSTRRY